MALQAHMAHPIAIPICFPVPLDPALFQTMTTTTTTVTTVTTAMTTRLLPLQSLPMLPLDVAERSEETAGLGRQDAREESSEQGFVRGHMCAVLL